VWAAKRAAEENAMSMRATIQAFKTKLPGKSQAFAEARTRHRALAAYETPASLAVALAPASGTAPAQRERIVAALLAENHLAPVAVWQSLLVLAFEGSLLRLRAKVARRRREDADELDQHVLLAFLDSVRAVRPSRHTTLALVWGAEARTSGAKRPREQELDEDCPLRETRVASPDVQLEVKELLESIEAHHGRDVLEAIVATEIGGETLLEHVARRHPELSPSERACIYDRIQRARNEALDRLRLPARSCRAA